MPDAGRIGWKVMFFPSGYPNSSNPSFSSISIKCHMCFKVLVAAGKRSFLCFFIQLPRILQLYRWASRDPSRRTCHLPSQCLSSPFGVPVSRGSLALHVPAQPLPPARGLCRSNFSVARTSCSCLYSISFLPGGPIDYELKVKVLVAQSCLIFCDPHGR